MTEIIPTHQHRKRGTNYALLGIGKMQAKNWFELDEYGDVMGKGEPSVDMREVAIYQGIDDGAFWVRPIEQFNDEAFEALIKENDPFERTFVRVYRLPPKLTEGYCFGAGNLITFSNVDWFEAPVAEGPEKLIEFIKGKIYFKPDQEYLVIGDHPDFTFRIGKVGA